MISARDFLTDQVILRSDDAPLHPAVSIILPTYARCASGLLARAVESILAQSFADWELLVMDDGSRDGTFDLVEGFRARDRRIVHVRHEWNCGLPALRVNEGIELARGRYLAFQFDDDFWYPDALRHLVTAAEDRTGPALVAGICRHTVFGQLRRLPPAPVQVSHLYRENQIANNAVLLPRVLIDRLGMYDCHLAMRPLCDWDLWMRYATEVPLVIVDEVVSESVAGQPNSIGTSVPRDLAMFRYLHDIPRNHLLTPGRWRDYAVDALQIGGVELTGEFRRIVYEDHVVPYYLKQRHHLPALEGFPATLTEKSKTCLLVRNWYEPTHEIAFNPYDALSTQRGTYKMYYQQVDQVHPNWNLKAAPWTREADALLLVRSVETEVRQLATEALQSDIPLGYYMDDDLLTFSEYGPEFDYLAPGAPLYQNLVDYVGHADVVWCNTRFIAESARRFNPRTIPHHGCIPATWLPHRLRPRDPSRPIKIGYAGTGYRLDEFTHLWSALTRVSEEFGDRLIFEFWGLDVSTLAPLGSPVIHHPYNPSYRDFIQQLKKSDLDVMVMPLLDHPRPRLGKSASKYFQTAVAGALAIFSDVPQYAALPDGFTCLKPANDAEAWYAALRSAITMPPEQFDRMRRRMVEHVREEYTDTAQIHLHEAAWRATEFHAKTRQARGADGRPRVAYVFHSPNFGGSEIQLWRRLRLARLYGIEPVVVLPRHTQASDAARRVVRDLEAELIQMEFLDYSVFTEPRSPEEFNKEEERAQVRAFLGRLAPALVHTVVYNPTFGQVCDELKIPHVASLYAVDDEFAWKEPVPHFTYAQVVQSDSIRYATRWGKLLRTDKFCSRALVPETVFALGQARHFESMERSGPPPQRKPVRMIVTGTFQERKRQLQTVQAFGQIVQEGWDCELDFYGYTNFYPEYVARCEEQIRAYGIQERVKFRGFADDVVPVLKSADVLLSLSTYESFPTSIKEAMAARVLVVATPVGGISELIIDGVSGILCADTTVEAIVDGMRRALKLEPAERECMVEQARRVARSEFHPHRVASDLMWMYNRALDSISAIHPRESRVNVASDAALTPIPYGRSVLPKSPPSGSTRLRHQLVFPLAVESPRWMEVDVLIGTDRTLTEGRVHLRVLSPSGQLLREACADLAGSQDQSWIQFRFTPIANAGPKPFIGQFTLDSPTLQKISFYTAGAADTGIERGLNLRLGRSTRPSLYCRMWYVN